MRETTTLSVQTYQGDGNDGYNNGGVWGNTAPFVGGTIGKDIGLAFDPKSVVDSATSGISTFLSTMDVELTVYTGGLISNVGFTFRYVTGTDGVFSTSFLPTVANSSPLYKSDGSLAQYSSTGAVAANTVITFSDMVVPTEFTSILRPVYVESGEANPYILLVIILIAFQDAKFWSDDVLLPIDDAQNLKSPKLTLTGYTEHTGYLDGPSFGRRSRTRECPRTGMPVASDAMVRDGYREGLMVSREAWDPEDPEDRYVPNPNEGVVDDEV